MEARFREILLDKPEIVSSFPAWMLADETRERLRAASRPAVVEIAGRDSVAAAVRAAAGRAHDLYLPTIAYTGTEYGDWRTPFEKVAFLAERLASSGAEAEVLPPVLLGAPDLWRTLCGRYIAELSRRYGFYTPCLGCHVYLHALRIPLARITGCRVVVAGERERHDGRVKVNQIAPALDAYVELAARFDVELALPLRYVSSGSEVEELVGADRPETGAQLSCVLSENYRDADGGVAYDAGAVSRYLDEFALPAAERAVKAYVEGEVPRYGEIAEI
jgi:hypothetical protein